MEPKEPSVAINAMQQLPVIANDKLFTGLSRLLQLLHSIILNRLRAQAQAATMMMFACPRPTPSRPKTRRHHRNHITSSHRYHSALADVPSPRTPSPSQPS